jgi:hypothetical protein
MKITPTQIIHSGPGIDLSSLPEGVSIKMSDPVKDFKYARNAVTLTFDLSGYENVHLAFEAMEFGDEPHAPPPNPFTVEADFDGVAVSADGVAWYEIQDLRHLRSDRFLGYDIDLDAAIAQWGLSYSSEFQIRFCQYDNNPASMDGIFLHKIELLGDLRPPILHLTMNDNASNPTVLDSAASQRHQTFIDPGGNPSTNAHSVPGPNGTTALAFDGVDDRIDFGPTLLSEMVGAGRDFSLAFWYKTDSSPGDTTKIFFRRRMSFSEPHVTGYVSNDRIYWLVGWGDGYMWLYSTSGMLNGQWRHVVYRRQGQTLTLWIDGALQATKSHPDYAKGFFAGAWDPRAIGQVYQGSDSDWPFAMADFRAYDRALRDEEITELSA